MLGKKAGIERFPLVPPFVNEVGEAYACKFNDILLDFLAEMTINIPIQNSVVVKSSSPNFNFPVKLCLSQILVVLLEN